MKQTGMLVVSLRGVNFWILVSLRVFRAKRQYFMYACIGSDDHVFISLKPAHCMSYLRVFKRSPFGGQILLKPRPDWSPLGVTKSSSHAQTVSLWG